MLFGGRFGAAVPVQSGRKRNLPSAWPKPLRKCAVSKSGCTSTHLLVLEAREVAEAALAEHDVDMLLLGQAEARHVGDAEPLGQFLDDEMVGARALAAGRSASARA